jgi:hypothetical protein
MPRQIGATSQGPERGEHAVTRDGYSIFLWGINTKIVISGLSLGREVNPLYVGP